MSAMRIKKGDTVKVIAGSDKGRQGKVTKINVKDRTVIVEGVNMVSKHQKPNAANQQGGIIQKESPIDVSNVMLVFKGKTTKVGYKYEDGKDGRTKVRVAKATGEVID